MAKCETRFDHKGLETRIMGTRFYQNGSKYDSHANKHDPLEFPQPTMDPYRAQTTEIGAF